MIALRATRSDWTAQRWKQAVKQIAAQGWGALGHGGVREKPASVVQRSGSAQGALAKTVGDDASAVGEHCGGLLTKAVGDASGVGEHSGGAQGALAKIGGDVSAVGEEVQPGVDSRCQGEEDACSVQAECGSSSQADEQPVVDGVAGSGTLPAILPPVRAQNRCSGYKVVEIMSSGSFGDVYKVRKNGSGYSFAVKVMLKTSRTAQRSEEQCRELAIMKSLSGKHPNLMNLLGWRDTAFNFQLFMPLYEMDLRKYIQRAPVLLRSGKTIISQLCSAVAYLHENQFMHRDIKPPNILIKCQPLAAVLGDFGCAKAFLPGQPMTPKMCTLWYRSPEILANQEAYDLSSDVWSLGVTFVEIELGQAPFQHSSEMGMLRHIVRTCGGSLANGETMTKQNAGAHPWGRRYGPRFEELIDAMLVVEPARRKSAGSCMRCSFIDVALTGALASAGIP